VRQSSSFGLVELVFDLFEVTISCLHRLIVRSGLGFMFRVRFRVRFRFRFRFRVLTLDSRSARTVFIAVIPVSLTALSSHRA